MSTAFHQLPTKLNPGLTLAANRHLLSTVKRRLLASRTEPPAPRTASCLHSPPSLSLSPPPPPLTYSRTAGAGRTWGRRTCATLRCGSGAGSGSSMLREAEDDLEIVYDSGCVRRQDGGAPPSASEAASARLGRGEEEGGGAGEEEEANGAVVAESVDEVHVQTRFVVDNASGIHNVVIESGFYERGSGVASADRSRYQLTDEFSIRDLYGVSLIDVSKSLYMTSSEFRNSVLAQAMMTSRQILSWRRWDLTRFGRSLLKGTREEVPPNSVKFEIMCYNVLAQDYVEAVPFLYKRCPAAALSWDYRSKCLLQEIRHHSPDILCMQEVQEEHYFDFVSPELIKAGYLGVFKKKTGRKKDGSAIFYRPDMFDLISYTAPEFNVPHVRVLDREMIGLMVHLTPKGRDEEDSFVVATTHLLYNPHRCDIRLAQLQVFFAELDRVAFCGLDPSVGNSPRYRPTILCGDFNENPWSPVYKFVTLGRLRFAGRHAGSLLTTDTGGRVLGNELLPPYLAITDSCQHACIAAHRLRCTGCPPEILQMYEDDESSYLAVKNIFPIAGTEEADKWRAPPRTVGPEFWRRDFVPLGGEDRRRRSDFDRDPSARSGWDDDDAAAYDPPPPPSVEDDEFDGRDPFNRLRDPYGTGLLTHGFDFRSVYMHRHNYLPDRPYEVTTYQNKWMTVDYIFYTVPYNPLTGRREENRLQLLARHRLLNPEQCDKIGTCPTYGVPSDHFPTLARFLLRLKPDETRRRLSC